MQTLIENVNIVNPFEEVETHKNVLIEDINFVCVDYECDFFETLNKIKPLNSPDDIPNVLLAHVPKLKPEDLKDYNIFLFLCGHTHGGKCFPFTLVKLFLGRWLTIIIEGLYIFYKNTH